MNSARLFVFALTTFAASASAQTSAANAPSPVTTHDNVRSAGRLENGVLTVSLRAGIGRWYPEGQASPSRDIETFGEEGQPLTVPSPLIRARVGTVVQVSIRNTLGSPIRVFGLCDRPGTCGPLTIAAGATGEARFRLGAAGTFHYWAATRNQSLAFRDGADSQLGGVIVADDASVDPRERIFVIGLLRKVSGEVSEIAVLNGRSWPMTERFRYAVGDTVRWRVVNLSHVAHAMHLHGFYFNVESTGDGMSDTRSMEGGSRGVTARVPVGGTFAMSWMPERAGNWLFHCHMLEHMLPDAHDGPAPAYHGPDTTAAGMAGLVLGVRVTGPEKRATIPDNERRKFQLSINPDTRLGDVPSFKVDISEAGVAALRVNERAAPGPILVVTRGQPVAIEILNHLDEPTAIHWHGIELESYDDGVADFGGSSGSVTPPVAPHGTFTARFTPPRAGTFIYHTHWHNAGQLSGGIYGPLVVLEPGERFDPESDHIVVLGLEGRYRTIPNEPFAVNGEARPRALELKAGIPHRLRFINITGDGVGLTVQLLSVHDPVRWTLLAKDGAEVPSSQRSVRPARQQIGVGETYDFALAPMTPREEGLWLELRRGTGELVFQWPVRVK
ncbi:MAG TPA: multicopper oxidase domain-containing protein [Gemmatimonadaceae bacterium]|nr:multicopper oxidase domain-containing protein [Gemmatimonadaceae bacterium]